MLEAVAVVVAGIQILPDQEKATQSIAIGCDS